MATQTDDLANFRNWYSRVLNCLYADRENGIAVFTIILPLLERYLRGKCGLSPAEKLTMKTDFFPELAMLFPALTSRQMASDFWAVYRNGILHQGALAKQRERGQKLPPASFTRDIETAVEVKPTGEFVVRPDYFARAVVAAIEADFQTYANAGTFQPPLMRITTEIAPSTYQPSAPNAPIGFVVTTKTN